MALDGHKGADGGFDGLRQGGTMVTSEKSADPATTLYNRFAPPSKAYSHY